MKKSYLIFVSLTFLALFLSACNGVNKPPSSDVETQAQATTDALLAQQAGASPTSTAILPTNTLPATYPSTASPIPATNTPTATATLTNEQIYSACPTSSLNEDPNTKKPLIFVKDPYPGVLCEYEVYFKDRDYIIDLASGQGALVADWTVGKFWDPISGELLDGCPTGAKCEGTWVMNSDTTVPAGTLAHVYIYSNLSNAVVRFLGTPNLRTAERKDSFACEYLAYSSQFGPHDNRNIRVPEWAKAFGSIYGHTGCVDFAGNPGETDIVIEATLASNQPACEKPTNDEWVWRQNEFWHYTGDPISFQVPSWIEKVIYEDNTNSNTDLTATNGQQVTNAVAAKAFCE